MNVIAYILLLFSRLCITGGPCTGATCLYNGECYTCEDTEEGCTESSVHQPKCLCQEGYSGDRCQNSKHLIYLFIYSLTFDLQLVVV